MVAQANFAGGGGGNRSAPYTDGGWVVRSRPNGDWKWWEGYAFQFGGYGVGTAGGGVVAGGVGGMASAGTGVSAAGGRGNGVGSSGSGAGRGSGAGWGGVQGTGNAGTVVGVGRGGGAAGKGAGAGTIPGGGAAGTGPGVGNTPGGGAAGRGAGVANAPGGGAAGRGAGVGNAPGGRRGLGPNPATPLWTAHAIRHDAFVAESNNTLERNQKIALQTMYIDRPILHQTLEPLPYQKMLTQFSADPDVVESLSATYFNAARNGSLIPGYQFLGFDTEFEHLSDNSQVSALVQLGCQRNNGYDVLEAHIAHLRRIPSSLRRVIEERRIIKLAHDAYGDIKCLEEIQDTSFPVGDPRRKMKCRSILEIDQLAIRYWDLTGNHQYAAEARKTKMSLSRLCELFLGIELTRAPGHGISWARKELPLSKKKYAMLDAWAVENVFRSIYYRLETAVGAAVARQTVQSILDESMHQQGAGYDY
ncbi:hypothetical protein HDV00_002007 [Rhizophlyctis rosea]|nr:hypothetical protein HDV00_002007 [Rhizophlyctis rosea]